MYYLDTDVNSPRASPEVVNQSWTSRDAISSQAQACKALVSLVSTLKWSHHHTYIPWYPTSLPGWFLRHRPSVQARCQVTARVMLRVGCRDQLCLRHCARSCVHAETPQDHACFEGTVGSRGFSPLESRHKWEIILLAWGVLICLYMCISMQIYSCMFPHTHASLYKHTYRGSIG